MSHVFLLNVFSIFEDYSMLVFSFQNKLPLEEYQKKLKQFYDLTFTSIQITFISKAIYQTM
jgi:hypothetical protein